MDEETQMALDYLKWYIKNYQDDEKLIQAISILIKAFESAENTAEYYHNLNRRLRINGRRH